MRRHNTEEHQSRKRTVLIGTKQTTDLQAVEKKACLYVGKLRSSTTEETLKKYLNKNGVKGVTECEELATRGNTKAFKVGIPFKLLGETENTSFWPEGVLIR